MSVEGTRNFIANDIVAHNTYLATSSGNVGIGTTSPIYQLHVLGNVSLNSTLYAVDGKVGINISTPVETLSVKGNFSTTNTNGTIGNFTIGKFNQSCGGF